MFILNKYLDTDDGTSKVLNVATLDKMIEEHEKLLGQIKEKILFAQYIIFIFSLMSPKFKLKQGWTHP